MTAQLENCDGTLYLPDGSIMLVRYPEGDYDTIAWPDYNADHLASCLFDERECGNVVGNEVILPDGKIFRF